MPNTLEFPPSSNASYTLLPRPTFGP